MLVKILVADTYDWSAGLKLELALWHITTKGQCVYVYMTLSGMTYRP